MFDEIIRGAGGSTWSCAGAGLWSECDCISSLFPAQNSPKGLIHIWGLFFQQLFKHSHRIAVSLTKRLKKRCKERIQRGLFEFLTLVMMYLQNVSWNMHLISRRSPGDTIIQEALLMSCKQHNLGHAILKNRQTPEKMQFHCFCQRRLSPNNSHHSCCCDSPKHSTYWEVMQKYDFIFKKILKTHDTIRRLRFQGNTFSSAFDFYRLNSFNN